MPQERSNYAEGVQLATRIPKTLHTALRVAAVKTERSMQAIVSEAIAAWVEKHKSGKSKKKD